MKKVTEVAALLGRSLFAVTDAVGPLSSPRLVEVRSRAERETAVVALGEISGAKPEANEAIVPIACLIGGAGVGASFAMMLG